MIKHIVLPILVFTLAFVSYDVFILVKRTFFTRKPFIMDRERPVHVSNNKRGVM